jgi:hypothetical protein
MLRSSASLTASAAKAELNVTLLPDILTRALYARQLHGIHSCRKQKYSIAGPAEQESGADRGQWRASPHCGSAASRRTFHQLTLRLWVSFLAGTTKVFFENVHEQGEQHEHAAGVRQRRDKRKKSDSRKQEKTGASEQSPENWNAREPNMFAPSVHDADVVPHREKSAQGQKHGCRDCQRTHSTQNVQAT